MGYWGYYVVARSERPLGELATLGPVRAVLQPLDLRPDGWQVWEYATDPAAAEQPGMGSMNRLARESGQPALFGYVMDSACVVVEGASPVAGAWTACLGREALARYLRPQDCGGLTVDDYFPPAGEAAAHAVRWAAEAGAHAETGRLLALLTHAPETSAEHSFFRFLDRLGVLPI
ncbi:hypothetical protein [Streptomyces sp. NPDC007088]|uniref:hypothetical protein n=1 Tax=Streptomyces sp. NPDC007088 TaxID=3364773 RepID=UPI0036A6B6EF